MRQSLACCVISLPVSTTTTTFQNRARHLADAVFQFQAFTDQTDPPNEAFAEFNGLFVAKKLPRINGLVRIEYTLLWYVGVCRANLVILFRWL